MTKPGQAQTSNAAVEGASQAVITAPKVRKALDDIKADDAATFAEQKKITEIAAPPYKEKVRAEYYLKRMQELGLKDASIDAEGNVIALRKGMPSCAPGFRHFSAAASQATSSTCGSGAFSLTRQARAPTKVSPAPVRRPPRCGLTARRIRMPGPGE